MDRCALFVDAGYVLADGAMAVHGTRRRESVSWDYAGLLQFLAGMAAERSGFPLLRCYWYEATVEGRRSADHDTLADLPGVKLRLAKMRPGRREGVEGEIHRDLATLARNKAVSDAMVVSAEEDLAGVIADVQDLGMRVTMAHITVDGNWTISRALRQECDDIVEINSSHLRPYVELISGAEPAQADDGGAGQAGLSVVGRGPSFTPAAAGANGNGHQLAAVYAEPVAAEYPRAVSQPSRQRADEPARSREGLPVAALPPAPPAPPAAGDERNWADGQVPMPAPGQPAFDDAPRPGQPLAAPYQPGMPMPQPPGYGVPPAPNTPNTPSTPSARPDYPPMPAGYGARQDAGEPQDLYASLVSGPIPGPVPGGPVADLSASRGYTPPDLVAYNPGAPREAPQNDMMGASLPGNAGPDYRGHDLANSGPIPQAEPVPAGPGAQVRRLPARGPAGVGPQDPPSPVVPLAGAQPNPQQAQPLSVAVPVIAGPVAGGPGGYAPGRPQAYSGPQPLLPVGHHAQPGLPPAGGLPAGAPAPMPPNGVAPMPGAGVGPMNEIPPGNEFPPPGPNFGPAGGYAPAGGPVPDNGPVPAGQLNGLASVPGTPVLGAPVASPPIAAAVPGVPVPAAPVAAAPPSAPGMAPGLAPVHSAAFGGGQPAAAASLADAVQSAHEEGQEFGSTVARDAPALWLEAVLARKPRMPSDLEARLLQGSSLPIDFLLHDEVRHALRRGFWDALERARR